MSHQPGLLRSPLFRVGMPAMTSLIIAAIALLIVDDRLLRILMLVIAALDLLVTPQILKRAARNA
ncbi:hypothetical protein EXE45_11095 [Halorubrum sp. SP9]|nr:hypothetical protein EXE45_11095 [Halorubrum sp. SP9]